MYFKKSFIFRGIIVYGGGGHWLEMLKGHWWQWLEMAEGCREWHIMMANNSKRMSEIVACGRLGRKVADGGLIGRWPVVGWADSGSKSCGDGGRESWVDNGIEIGWAKLVIAWHVDHACENVWGGRIGLFLPA